MSTEIDVSVTLTDLIMDIDSVDYNVVFTNAEALVFSEKRTNNGHDMMSSSLQHINKLNKKQYCEEQSSGIPESKITPRRAHYNSKGQSKLKQNDSQANARPCEQHTFLTDITEVRQMEQGLLKLLDDFHLGKLQAFGKDCTFERMEQVREQQERLARVHFELNAHQEMYGPQSEDGRRVGRENLGKLIENLQQLSRSIEHLQISNPILQTDV